MFIYPMLSPIAFTLGPLKVHWYGLMYLLGFLLAFAFARWRVLRYHLSWRNEEIGDLIFYGALGVIIGGRLGYMLFYDTHQFIVSPWSLFKLWEGGMSFHGGLLGVAVALLYFAYKYNRPFLQVTDFLAPMVPLGLAAGRVGNFINAELWGRVTTLPWGMVFPGGGSLPRHPSQWYEFTLEGVFLWFLLWWYSATPRPLGRVSALFLMGYAVCRFSVEFVREPDGSMGFVAFNWLTMGQLLSIPMLIAGLILWCVTWESKVCKPI